MKILGIETSCDDTSAAIVNEKFHIYSNIISSQKIHNKFGGVVPELASREHIRGILPIVKLALSAAKLDLSEIDAIAVSVRPGLIGSLLVGVSFAKSLAYCLEKPLISVNHILGHICANFLEHRDIEFPFISLIVSGGHTELVKFQDIDNFEILGRTVDDAAGEAFDKIGKILNLPFPGGPEIDRIAKMGDKNSIKFPLPMINKPNYDFSFSGLKTAAALYIQKNNLNLNSRKIYDFAASFQHAIVKVLFKKTIKAIQENGIKTFLLAGGVAANSKLRNIFENYSNEHNLKVFFPTKKLCTDNAAMIAAAGIFKYQKKQFADLKLNASSQKGL
ncbi:MAG: tRNA (adenosine(37)-N6)-threonylcarbamoyltransferase complex transferase subunit TsaD [Candidatus Cloacimonetes bacterium]|nr:tRNA (adenosine(37)-N6)-threonylcarbamoyltransferase complex transferase subunit TsaD [Candidatus Cloacimonadota bacterium]MBL7107737.1 tRNA (adenosine(37)-N6)-threonylcarbamoyltransferase complex transferase subunit TsaD [Candidatus Cloacimonadota bacterium]